MFAGIVATFLYFVFTVRRASPGKDNSTIKHESYNNTEQKPIHEFPIHRGDEQLNYPPLINDDHGI